MKILFLLSVFGILLSAPLFPQHIEQIFTDTDEISLKENQKFFLDKIKTKNNYKKLKLVKLTNFEFPKSDKLTLKLFEDTDYSFVITEAKKIDSSNYKILGTRNSDFISLIFRNGNISGTIQANTKQYSIIPLGESFHAIIEVDYSKMTPEAPPVKISDNNLLHKETSVQTAGDYSTIDILVAYTPAAKAAVNDMIGLIENACFLANQSFMGDNIYLNYNVVFTTEFPYSEGNKEMLTILEDFRNNATIQSLREEYSADLCFLITNGNNISGISYLITSPDSYLSQFGFAIANYDRVRDTYTLSHETGHNLGGEHNPEETNTTSYNHGFLYSAGHWCTIMSYYGDSDTRQNFWSNPNKTYQGVTRGNTQYCNNARKLEEDRKAVALFREPQLSGTLLHNQTISGRAYTISSNLTIAPGVTLTISPSASLSVTNGASLIVNGTLNVNGTPSNYVTFNFGSPNSGTQNGIKFNSGSKGSIQYATVQNAYYGIYANSANVTISNNIIQNNSTGIRIYSSGSNITNNTIRNNANYGIQADNIGLYPLYQEYSYNDIRGNSYAMLLNNAAAYIHNNVMTDNYHGVVITSANPQFCGRGSNLRGYNTITCSSTPLFRAENSSSIYLGYDYDGGYNSIFGSELPDMEAYNNSQICADNNYWGSMYPAVWADGTSTIVSRSPLGSNPNPGSNCDGMYSNSASTDATLVGNTVDDNISEKYWKANTAGIKKDYQNANKLLSEIISSNYDPRYSPLALIVFYNLNSRHMKTMDKNNTVDSLNVTDKEVTGLLQGLYAKSEKDPLRPFAVRLLAKDAALSNNLADMKAYNSELAEKYPNSNHELVALYDLFTYYAEIERDYTLAQKCLNRMIAMYPKEDLTAFAKINLGGKNSDPTNPDLKNVATDNTKGTYLENAYPNPFNPTTIISYNLKNRDRVSLIVYDVLGKEVSRLVDGVQEQGFHTVSFDGSSLPSGIYIYRLKGSNFSFIKKIMLVK